MNKYLLPLLLLPGLALPACNSPLLPKSLFRLAGTKPTASGPAAEPVLTPPPPPAAETPSLPAANHASGAKQAVVVTRITFDVLQVRVPQGMLSQSGKVWNHLETDFLPAETAKLLHRNGMKAGRGSTDSWPPIKAIFETEPRVETSRNSLALTNGLPLLLELGHPKDQILFVYHRDGTLAGAPWPTSTNLLRIEYGMSPRRADAMAMDIMPELRPDSPTANEPRGGERWNLMTPMATRSLVLRDLVFRVDLAPGQFIALGPSAVTRELPYVVGSLMLCDERDGEKFESMYFLTPTVTRTGA